MPSAKKTAAPAKKSTPAKAPAAKSTPAAKSSASTKAAAKPSATKMPAKPTAPSGSSPKPGTMGRAPASNASAAVEQDNEAPAIVPKAGFTKIPGRDTLCQIEIVKDGHFFIARTQTEGGADKEYKNTVFEDLLTEMVITLQEQLVDK
jgi:hypothetical protein